ncbi:MAG: hypothetical protein ABSC13_05580 [Dehalococcoidia bacterium]|jgi:hypothetical protein
MVGIDPLVEEVLVAAVAVSVLIALISVLYWLSTGLSPWPVVILAAIAGFAPGIAMLSIASPRHHR